MLFSLVSTVLGSRTFSFRTLRGTYSMAHIFYKPKIYCLIGDNFGWFIHTARKLKCMCLCRAIEFKAKQNEFQLIRGERAAGEELMWEEGNKGCCSFFFSFRIDAANWIARTQKKQHWLCFGFVSHRSYYRAICQIVHQFSIAQIVDWIVLHTMSKYHHHRQ